MNIEKKNYEMFNAISHLTGALLSVAGLTLLVIHASKYGDAWHVVSFTIFGASLILLYASSTIFHYTPLTSRRKPAFKRIDHAMIFVLIAGSYTPVCLVPLRGGWGWSVFGIIWAIAIFGITVKALRLNISLGPTALIYLVMGWLAVIAFYPLVKSLPNMGILWLVAGGLSYTLGAILYGLDKEPPTTKWINLHGVFHLLVMLGSFCHFWLMFRYVLYL